MLQTYPGWKWWMRLLPSKLRIAPESSKDMVRLLRKRGYQLVARKKRALCGWRWEQLFMYNERRLVIVLTEVR